MNEIRVCECCFEDIDINNVVYCTNKIHMFCKKCINDYVTIGLFTGELKTDCIYNVDKCTGKFTFDTIKKCLSETNYEKFIEFDKIIELRKIEQETDNFKICPFCKIYGIVSDQQFIYCNKCLAWWCTICNKSSHQSKKCNDLFDVDDVRKKVHDVMSDSLIHGCPICHVSYIKYDGCNLIVCKSCATRSCYVCNMVIPPRRIPHKIAYNEHYHFKNSIYADFDAVCPLYNDKTGETSDHGTKKYNDDKLFTNLLKMLIGEKNESIRKIMINELDKQGIICTIHADTNKEYYTFERKSKLMCNIL